MGEHHSWLLYGLRGKLEIAHGVERHEIEVPCCRKDVAGSRRYLFGKRIRALKGSEEDDRHCS